MENENQRSYISTRTIFISDGTVHRHRCAPGYIPVKKYFLSGYRNRVQPNFLYTYCLNTPAIVYAEVTVCTFRYC